MNARILVIEDNAASRELIAYLLRASGYEVACATNAIDGLDTALSNVYDLVLSDILMPDMDGYEFARRFRALRDGSKTPLIAVTALAMTGDREQILDSGFDGYVSKPIDPHKFAGQIASFLKTRG